MQGPVDPAFRERLAALADKFAAGLPATLARLRALRAGFDAAAPAPAARGFYEILHTLAGSAGTFGHAPLGDAARRLEQGLRALDQGGGWPGWLAELDRFIAWAESGHGRPPGAA